jgi:hypothetical protein
LQILNFRARRRLIQPPAQSCVTSTGRSQGAFWNLGSTGYSGCSEASGDSADGKVRVCIGPSHINGPNPTIKILVSRTAGGFEATRASLEFVTFEATAHRP